LTVEKLNHLLDQINELMGEENREAVGQMLQHVESLTEGLADERDTISALPGELSSLLRDTRAAVGDVQTALQTVQPGLEKSMDHIAAASANIDALTSRVDSLVAASTVEFATS
jgi:ABC-type transporter Mla subunit MlaD